MEEVFQAPQVAAGRGSETMLAPPEVQRMLALKALEIIRRELDITMALCGLRDVRQAGPDNLVKSNT